MRILSEAASVKIATPIELKPSDLKESTRVRSAHDQLEPSRCLEGGTWSLRDIVEYNHIATMAVLNNAASYRDRWVGNFLSHRSRHGRARRSARLRDPVRPAG
ncbi:MAG: hypothetical protein R3A46_07785 [Thermomicrobiales bacterium]